jgi:hypothetical protein
MAGGLIAAVPFSLAAGPTRNRSSSTEKKRVASNVRIYNRALSPAEVKALYHLGTATIRQN